MELDNDKNYHKYEYHQLIISNNIAQSQLKYAEICPLKEARLLQIYIENNLKINELSLMRLFV